MRSEDCGLGVSMELHDVIRSLNSSLKNLSHRVGAFSLLWDFLEEEDVWKIFPYQDQLHVLEVHVKRLESFVESGCIVSLDIEFEHMLFDLKFGIEKVFD